MAGEALKQCWHPVSYSHELGSTPRGTWLLGEPLVLWRDSARQAHALHDVCIHRGTALSLGRVDGGEIICAYHGWGYDGTGACTRIPQLEDPTAVPAKARVASYFCQERYGIIWVSLHEPLKPLPEIPELESAEWVTVFTGPFSWQCDSSRQVENFTDFGHFPWVHPGLLGDPERPVVPPHSARIDGMVVHYEIVRPEAANSDDFPVFSNPEQARPERRSRYELHLPYTIVLRLGWGGREGMVYLFASQPENQDRCRGYCAIGRNYNLEQPPSVLEEFERVIFSQDQRVVESQRPDRVPFDLAQELHLKFDAVAVAYRRAMKANSLS
jgi:phenylpropionate dioxygenase-like ring-hydroxylating dioxygenase large terminal subunit